MSRRTVITAVIATAWLATGAGAVTNPGFETGDATGWTLTIPPGGSAGVVTQHQGDLGTWYAPPEGSYFLLLKTNGSGSYTRAEQIVTLAAGGALSGRAAFDARDYVPYNDNASVRVLDSAGALVAMPWYSDVATIGNYGDGPWTLWNWTAPSAGTYVLRYEVANYGDDVLDAFALFDGAFSDTDQDGIDDGADNCPDTPNPDQADLDGDGVGEVCDNCPQDANSGQEDGDGDGLGDCCDPDEPDCNGNGDPDVCDIRSATSKDCNGNGIPDECDIASGTSGDCNGNGIPDDCETDCNSNGVPDDCDLSSGASADCNGNDIPDECDVANGLSSDCQTNGTLDSCDIDLGTSQDCNANGVPDECDTSSGASSDCQPNAIPDECEWAALQSKVPAGSGGAGGVAAATTTSVCQLPDQQMHGGAFAVSLAVDLGVGAAESFTFTDSTVVTSLQWWGTYGDECGDPCAATDDFVATIYVTEQGPASTVVGTYALGGAVARTATGLTIPQGPGLPEYEYWADLFPPLVVEAGQRYWVDLHNATGTSCAWWWETAPEGFSGNGTSLYDANGDGYDVADLVPHDLAICGWGIPASQDCNTNGIHDTQDILDGTSKDCQPNGIPDECEDDRDYNGVPDNCDIVAGSCKDLNFNGVPDNADCLTTPGDLDGDCDVDRDDLTLLSACMGASGASILSGCVCADFERNGTVDMKDYLAYSAIVGQPVVGCKVPIPGSCPDSWSTSGGAGGVAAGLTASQTFYDFGTHGPIPAGFFGAGSDPFGDIVSFVGQAADPSGVQGATDTQIDHGPVVFDAVTGVAQSTLNIITLDLISENPISVMYGGANPEQWLVIAGLSPHDPGSGLLTATLDDPSGNAGTYDATVYVQPVFLFVKRQDLIDRKLPECVTARVLDTGGSPAPPVTSGEYDGIDEDTRDGGLKGRRTGRRGSRSGSEWDSDGSVSAVSTAMPPITLSFTGQPFVRVADPTIVGQVSVPDCAQGNFVPGVFEPPGGAPGGVASAAGQQLTCTSHITPGEAHYFCPKECEGKVCHYYSKVGGPSFVGKCSTFPVFPSEARGSKCPSGNCSADRLIHRKCADGGMAFQTYGSPTCEKADSLCKGACCDDGGACTLSTSALCAGTYMGDGTDCGSVTCPQSGACCHGDGTCTELDPADCNAPNDTHQGGGTSCATATCPCANLVSISPLIPCVDVGGSLSSSDFDIVTDPPGYEASVAITPASFTTPGDTVTVTGTICNSSLDTTIAVIDNAKFNEVSWSDIQTLLDTIDAALSVIENVADAGGPPVCSFTGPDFSGDVSLFKRQRCCSDGVQTHNGATGQMSLGAGLACVPPGLGFKWKEWFEAGVTLGADLSGQASLTLAEDCVQPLSVCLGASITGKLIATVGVTVVLAEDLLNFIVTGTAETAANVTAGCCLNQAGSAIATLNPLSVSGKVDIKILGFWEVTKDWGPVALLQPITSNPIGFTCTLPQF